jgi:hypothetical protein
VVMLCGVIFSVSLYGTGFHPYMIPVHLVHHA